MIYLKSNDWDVCKLSSSGSVVPNWQKPLWLKGREKGRENDRKVKIVWDPQESVGEGRRRSAKVGEGQRMSGWLGPSVGFAHWPRAINSVN
jgi:hypothetical protein